MFGLQQITRLLRLLNQGQSPAQLSLALVLGLWAGLIPGWPLQVLLLVLIIGMLNINISMAIMGGLIGASLGWLIDPQLDQLGGWLLEDVAVFEPLWTALYNSPAPLLTRFNNTVVIGATLAGGLSAIVGFFILRRLIELYRERVLTTMQRFKIVQLLKGSRLIQLLQHMDGGRPS